MERTRKLSALLGLAATMATAGVATAQTQVNISGATLFANFFDAQAGTNDWNDVDGDGFAGTYGPVGTLLVAPNPKAGQLNTIDNLAPAPTITSGPYTVTDAAGTHWYFNYRGVGSGNGWAEMRDSQLARLNGDALGNGAPTTPPSDLGIYNGVIYSEEGAGNANANPTNGTGAPYTQTRIDMGVMDVPTTWFVTQSGVGAIDKKPGDSGYGNSGLESALGKGQNLKDIGNTSLNPTPLNTDTGSGANAYTVFDTPVAYVPIGAIANPGTGVTQITFDELKYLNATGRMPDGTNLTAVVRDSGSGTRNGFQNSIGLDPSWGRGEGYAPKNANDKDVDGDGTAENDVLGADYLPDQKGGSSRMEGTVQNSRLAIGHTGLLGGSRAGVDSADDKYDVLSVAKVGTNYVTPTTQSLVNNDSAVTGYQIGGVETIATVGDPKSATTGKPAMDNAQAAAYINNITDSLDNFRDDGNLGAEDVGMPSEFLAQTFLIVQGMDRVPSNNDGTVWVDDNLNQTVQDTILGPGVFSYSQGTAGDNGGRVPRRSVNVSDNGAYTDGTTVVGNVDVGDPGDPDIVNTYKAINGEELQYNARFTSLDADLANANDIQGDFGGALVGTNNARDLEDLGLMVDLIDNYTAGTWQATTNVDGHVAPDLLGDMDGDGNMTKADVRYFADGLYINGSGDLDRAAAFVKVDQSANSGNFFGTSLITGKAYATGDSVADIAGATNSKLGETYGAVAGYAPVGADGVVDAADINYVFDNFGDWSVLEEAVAMDLSADMNASMVVDLDDALFVIETVLGTRRGDTNLDGKVDGADLSILASNFGAVDPDGNSTWALSDYNGDGNIDGSDLSILASNFGYVRPTAIPEPAALALLAVGGLALIRRR